MTPSPPAETPIPWDVPDVDPDFDLEHPRVFASPAAIDRAADHAETGPAWASHIAEAIVDAAANSWWLRVESDEIREVMPTRGALYMFANQAFLCPIDGSRLEPVGWSNPGCVECESGHVFPDADHPDEGEGWVATDGERYRFVARWNGFVIWELTDIVEAIALAYHLTGEDRFAEAATAGLDALATVYPTAVEGPIGRGDVRRDQERGRVTRPGYQVARTLVRYVAAADLLWESPAFDGPSPTNPELTIRENIGINLLINGADFCERRMCEKGYDRLLHNGTADYVRGIGAVGAMFGIDSYIDWVTASRVSLDRFLANSVDRDGTYYETAMMYSEHGRRLYLSIAEILYHLDQTGDPRGWNPYDDPRLIALLRTRDRQVVGGRLPNYGDSGPLPDTDVLDVPFGFDGGPVQPTLLADHTFTAFTNIDSAREAFEGHVRLAARTDDPELGNEHLGRAAGLTNGPVADAMGTAWQLLNVDPAMEVTDIDPAVETGSGLLGGSGIAVLRSNEAWDRGVFFRYGPTLSHGHADELGINVFAAGRDATYDPGYGRAHYRRGWCRQTVSHVTGVVDEDTQLDETSPGGSLETFATGPGVRIVGADNPGAFPEADLDEYRRTLAYVDAPDGSGSYLIDLFCMDGGTSRTYSFHGMGCRFETDLDLESIASNSLANTEDFGGLINGDGRFSGDGMLPDVDEGARWTPPGSGFSFLGNPQRADGSGQWSASWRDDRSPGARTTIRMLGVEDREVIVADGPTPMNEILGCAERIPYVLARDQGTGSEPFVATIDAGTEPTVEQLSPLSLDAPDAVGVQIDLVDNGTDYFVQTDGDVVVEGGSATRNIATDARQLFLRENADGQVKQVLAIGATTVQTGTIDLQPERDTYEGNVIATDVDAATVTVDADLPAGTALAGSVLLMDNPAYSHNSPYVIRSVEPVEGGSRLHLDAADLIMARGRLEAEAEDGVLPNEVFLSFARNSVHLTPGRANRFFDGRRVSAIDGEGETTVKSVGEDAASLHVEDVSGFAAGNELQIHEVQAGDRFEIPIVMNVTRIDGELEIACPGPVTGSVASRDVIE